MTGCGIMSSVGGMILQRGSTVKLSIEVPASTRHRRDITEKLLKVTLNQNKQTQLSVRFLRVYGKIINELQRVRLFFLNMHLYFRVHYNIFDVKHRHCSKELRMASKILNILWSDSVHNLYIYSS